MNILCSDKTGTLTLNKMVIQDETPIYCTGETHQSLLTYAAMAAKWKVSQLIRMSTSYEAAEAKM